MKIILTGASSSIGRVLDGLLTQRGHELFRIVRRPSGFCQEILWDFNSPLPIIPGAVDLVVHLAGHVNFSEDMDPACYSVNALATFRLARVAAEMKSRFLFASTVSVHGSATDIGSTSLVRPAGHYAMSKWLGEELIFDICGDKAVAVRIAGVYGLEGAGHLGLNQAIRDAFYQRISPSLKGDGAGKRNYISILDAAQWFDYLAGHPDDFGGRRIYAASPEVLSIKQYLEIISGELADGFITQLDVNAASVDRVIAGTPAPFGMQSFGQSMSALRRLRER